MKLFDPRSHLDLLDSLEGLERLIQEEIAESDHLDVKITLDRRDPKYRDNLRIDAACLASSGRGYLVVGIDESRDGRNVLARTVGLPLEEAKSLSASIEDVVGTKIDPPIHKRLARFIPSDHGRAIVVAEFIGRAGYPASIERENDRGSVFYIRERGKNKPLSPQEARVRRREFDNRLRSFLIAAIVLIVLVGGALVYQQGRLVGVERMQRHRALSDEQHALLINKLQQSSLKKEIFILLVQDGEAHLFGDSLADTFRAAGWRVVTSHAMHLSGVGLMVLHYGPDDHRVEAEALSALLATVGIGTNVQASPDNVAPEDPHIALFVGVRPPRQP